MLHSFTKSARFRQWLLRTDCPPLMQQCRTLLDSAYDFSHDEYGDNEMVSEDGSMQVDEMELSRVAAPRGYFTIPSAAGKGNSFICFRPGGAPSAEWVPAQIHKILKRGTSQQFFVRRCLPLDLSYPDPFRMFWSQGFEAMMVSSSWGEIELVERDWIVNHPRIVLPILAAIVAGITVAVFDP